MKREVPDKLTTFKITNDLAQSKPYSLLDLDKEIREFLRAVQSGTQDKDFLKTRVKDIDNRQTINGVYNPDFGRAEAEIVAKTKNADLIEQILRHKNADIDVRNGAYGKNQGETPYQISRQDTEVKSGFMSMHGVRARKEAIMAARANNGDAWLAPTKNNPDRMQYYYPYQGLSQADPKDVRARHNQIFKYARQESNYESAKRRAKEQEKAEIEAQKEQDNNRKRQEREQRAQQRQQEQAQRGQQRQQNAQQKEQETQEDKEARRRKKQADMFKRGIVNALSVVVSIVTSILSVCRKILTSMLNSAVKASTDRVDASTVRMTASRKRELDNFDKAHNMKEGASFEATRATQSLFGNIEHPDTNAMEIFAPLLKEKLGDYVTMGMGKNRPEELTKILLQTLFDAYKQGINHLDVDVGSRERAFADINTALMRVAPEYSEVFSRLVEDYNSGNYGNFETVDEWYKTTPSNYSTGKVTEDDVRNTARVGEQWKSLLARLDQIYDMLLKIFTEPLGRLLSWLDQSTAGMTATEVINRDRDYLAKSLSYKEKNEERIKNTNNFARNDVKDFVRNTSHVKGIPDVVGDMDLSDIVAIGSGNMSNSSIKRNFEKFKKAGLQSTGRKDVENFKQTVISLYEDMLKSSRFNDYIPVMLYSQQVLRDINADKNLDPQYIGTGKIKDYSRVESQEATSIRDKELELRGFKLKKDLVVGANGKKLSDYDFENTEVMDKASKGIKQQMENDSSLEKMVRNFLLGENNGYQSEHGLDTEDSYRLGQEAHALISGFNSKTANVASSDEIMSSPIGMYQYAMANLWGKTLNGEQLKFLRYFDAQFEQTPELKKKYKNPVAYFNALLQEKRDEQKTKRGDFEEATKVTTEELEQAKDDYIQQRVGTASKELNAKYSTKEGREELVSGQYSDRFESIKYQIRKKKLEGAESRAENYRSTREKEKEWEVLLNSNKQVKYGYDKALGLAEVSYRNEMKFAKTPEAVRKAEARLEKAKKKAKEKTLEDYNKNPDKYMPDSFQFELGTEMARLSAKYSTEGLLLTPKEKAERKRKEKQEKEEAERKIREKHNKILASRKEEASKKYDADTNDYINSNIMNSVNDVSYDDLETFAKGSIDSVVNEHTAKSVTAEQKNAENDWDNGVNSTVYDKLANKKKEDFMKRKLTPEEEKQAFTAFMTDTPSVTIPLFYSQAGVDPNVFQKQYDSNYADPYRAETADGTTDAFIKMRVGDLLSKINVQKGNYSVIGQNDAENNTYTLIIKDDKGKILGTEQMNGRTGASRSGTLTIGESNMELQMSR